MKTITKYFPTFVLGLFFVLCRQTIAASQIKGTVTDTSGQPVEGAEVQFHAAVEGHMHLDLRLEGKATTDAKSTTDAKGRFEVPTSTPYGVIVVRKQGLAHGWIELDRRPTEPVRVTLTQPASVAGKVIDEAGKPVSGADVYATAVYSSASAMPGRRSFHYLTVNLARQLYRAKADADGRFRIDGFPKNASVNLAATAVGKATPCAESQIISPGLTEYTAGTEDVEMMLQDTGSVEGKIVMPESSQTLPTARLVLDVGPSAQWATGLEVLSKADGSFLFTNVPAGSYTLRAVFGTNTLPEWVAELVPVTIGPGRATTGVQIKATRGGVIEVSVVSEKGRKPESEVRLRVQSPNFRLWSDTGDDGVARVRLPAGVFDLLAYQHGVWAEKLQVTVEEGETNHVEVEIPAPVKIAGVVRRADGQPAANLEVRILSSYGLVDEKGVTDAAGRFEIEAQRAQHGMNLNYCVLARDVQNNLVAAKDFEDIPDTLQLTLGPALSFAGRVECEGKPVTNHVVKLLFWIGDSGLHIIDGLATNAAVPGSFEIRALPVGRRYGLIVSAPGCGQHSNSQLPSDEPQRIDLDPIELKPANLKLSGVVLDAEDKPVAGAMVQLHGEPQPSAVTRTDRKGRFTFNQVCDGQAVITATLSGLYGAEYGNATAQGGDTNVVVRLGQGMSQTRGEPRKLAGIVTDPEGKPVADAEVRIYPSNDRGRAKTDTNGRYNLSYYLEQWVLVSGEPACLVVMHRARNLAVAEEIEEGITNLNVQLKPALKLTGRVVNTAEGPITNAQINLWLIAGRTWSSVDDAPVSARSDGTFEITGLPAGPMYMLRASAPGHGVDDQQVDTGESQTNLLELPPLVLKVADKLIAGQVVDENDKPVRNAQVHIYGGEGQPTTSVSTDKNGRFQLKVCEGNAQLHVSSQRGYGQTVAEAGETNVVIQIMPYGTARPAPAKSASMKGKPCPDLADVGIAAEDVPKGKALVICLFDLEQRPSRRSARLLDEQYESLSNKGVAVVAVQTAPVSDEQFQEWRNSSPVHFPVGRVRGKTSSASWATGVKSLPWLILVDVDGKVAAEGFAIDELETKLAELKK